MPNTHQPPHAQFAEKRDAINSIVGSHRRPQKRLQTAANLPSTRIRARIIAPVTPSPPATVLTPSIRVHRWIRV